MRLGQVDAALTIYALPSARAADPRKDPDRGMAPVAVPVQDPVSPKNVHQKPWFRLRRLIEWWRCEIFSPKRLAVNDAKLLLRCAHHGVQVD